MPATGEHVVVLGAGTLGLAASSRRCAHFALPGTLLAVAKHPDPARPRRGRSAPTSSSSPTSSRRAVRRATGSLALEAPTGGSRRLDRRRRRRLRLRRLGASRSREALAVVRPGGRIVLVGMPGPTRVDLAPLWQREVALIGAYAYGTEDRPEGARSTFELAIELVAAARLERLVSARYPLDRYEEAIRHAAEPAGEAR